MLLLYNSNCHTNHKQALYPTTKDTTRLIYLCYWIHHIIKLANPPDIYAIGFMGGCGVASNWKYSCVPAESMRIYEAHEHSITTIQCDIEYLQRHLCYLPDPHSSALRKPLESTSSKTHAKLSIYAIRTYRCAESIMLYFISIYKAGYTREQKTSDDLLCLPWRTSWLRMIPVTPLRVHHFLVTSGPKAIPTPWEWQVQKRNNLNFNRHTRLLGPRPGITWGSVHNSWKNAGM